MTISNQNPYHERRDKFLALHTIQNIMSSICYLKREDRKT